MFYRTINYFFINACLHTSSKFLPKVYSKFNYMLIDYKAKVLLHGAKPCFSGRPSC